MHQQDIMTLRRRAFQYKRKHRLEGLIRKVTTWNDYQISEVLKHRQDLIRVSRGLHRRNGDTASSHQQFIQTSLLIDGWTGDYLMSALAWSHDMKDDHGETFNYRHNSRRYSPQMALEINRMSRSPEWKLLSFRDEVAESDCKIRSGGARTVVVKINDRRDNEHRPLKITSEKRRRKSGMKLWQTINSVAKMAKEIDYAHQELIWLSNLQQKRLGYTAAELDKLVLRPLDSP